MPVANIFDIGDNVDLQYSYTNASGALVNATAIAAIAINPLGSQAVLSPTRVATGSYEANTGTFDRAGRWVARFTATGIVNDAETISIIVRPDQPVRSDRAYANIDDVVRLVQGRTFTASSKPAIGDVQDWLALTAGEIDGLLRRGGYQLPVGTAATSALAALAHGNALGAACLIETGAPIPNRQSNVCKLYESFKKMVLAGDLELDAGKDATNSAPRSNAANQATGMFEREQFDSHRDW